MENETVYIAPGGRHSIVREEGDVVRIALNDFPPENGCRPAVDVLFRSAAQVYGGRQLGIILTGMGSDGTLGAKELKSKGVPIIVQDKESSVVWGMPGSAVNAHVADEVAPLMLIPGVVERMILG